MTDRQAKALADLEAASEAYRAANEARRAAVEALRRAIRNADKAGLTRTLIIRVTGVGRQTVYDALK